jgi:hypothetical protein
MKMVAIASTSVQPRVKTSVPPRTSQVYANKRSWCRGAPHHAEMPISRLIHPKRNFQVRTLLFECPFGILPGYAVAKQCAD